MLLYRILLNFIVVITAVPKCTCSDTNPRSNENSIENIPLDYLDVPTTPVSVYRSPLKHHRSDDIQERELALELDTVKKKRRLEEEVVTHKEYQKVIPILLFGENTDFIKQFSPVLPHFQAALWFDNFQFSGGPCREVFFKGPSPYGIAAGLSWSMRSNMIVFSDTNQCLRYEPRKCLTVPSSITNSLKNQDKLMKHFKNYYNNQLLALWFDVKSRRLLTFTIGIVNLSVAVMREKSLEIIVGNSTLIEGGRRIFINNGDILVVFPREIEVYISQINFESRPSADILHERMREYIFAVGGSIQIPIVAISTIKSVK